ncbi:MAG: type IV pilus modification PilV family protein [Janthinobacterium lividum]
MPRSQDGFTLIEVMAASAVLSAVVLCSVRSWAVVDQMSLDLQLRQKAVFALNGEAERLTKLYTAGGFSSPGAKASGPGTLQTVSGPSYVAIAGITGSSTRLVYATTTTGPAFDTTSVSGFASPTSSDSALWIYGSGTSTQDFVWLDRPRSIMARLSWVSCPVSASSVSVSNTAAVCWGSTASRPMAGLCYAYDGGTGGTSCSLVTLVLDYPFRLSNNVPVAESQLPGSHLTPTTLTLSTIVGRRL